MKTNKFDKIESVKLFGFDDIELTVRNLFFECTAGVKKKVKYKTVDKVTISIRESVNDTLIGTLSLHRYDKGN